jgi:hypothetical protein
VAVYGWWLLWHNGSCVLLSLVREGWRWWL